MRCGRCGYRFAGNTRRRKGHAYPEYVCCGYAGSGRAFCARFAVPQEVLEGLVLEQLDGRWGLALGADAVRARVEAEIARELAPATPQDPQEIRRKLAVIDERMLAIVQNLTAEHADIANTALSQLKTARAALQQELATSGAKTDQAEQLASAAPVIAALIGRFAEVLRTGAVPDRKAVLRAFIREVVIFPEDRVVEVIFWRLPRLSEVRSLIARASEDVKEQRVASEPFGLTQPVAVEGVAGAIPVLHMR